MPILIDAELETKLRARANAEGVTVEMFLARMVDDDEWTEEELEAFAIEGIESGEPIPGGEVLKNRLLADLYQRFPNLAQ